MCWVLIKWLNCKVPPVSSNVVIAISCKEVEMFLPALLKPSALCGICFFCEGTEIALLAVLN